MPHEEFDAVLARLDERSKSIVETMGTLSAELKEAKVWLTKGHNKQTELEGKLELLESEHKNSKEKLDGNTTWIDDQIKDQLKRKNDFRYDVVKLIASAVLGSTLTAIGLHFLNTF